MAVTVGEVRRLNAWAMHWRGLLSLLTIAVLVLVSVTR